MKNLLYPYFILSLIIAVLSSCSDASDAIQKKVGQSAYDKDQNELKCKALLQKHLDAVTNKDIKTLRSTLVPEGDFYFIMPQSEIMTRASDFAAFHEKWFQDTTWTFETKILDMNIGREIAFAVVEIIYREPERNGVPYFNRMAVSYGLKKINGNWYVAKDQACSLEKTKPKE